jgi:hypothetical protein
MSEKTYIAARHYNTAGAAITSFPVSEHNLLLPVSFWWLAGIHARLHSSIHICRLFQAQLTILERWC